MSATNRGAERKAQDFYPTPASAIDCLLPHLDLSAVHSFLEPCRGTGAVSNRFSCIPEHHWSEIREHRDYLRTEFPPVDLIVTNPPYSLALEFLEKSLLEAATVIYLLRVNWLGGKCRREFWSDNPPTHLFVLTPRPSFTGNGTDATEYAWFAWDRAGIVQADHWLTILSTHRCSQQLDMFGESFTRLPAATASA